jgi:hypothetical protein
VCLISEGSYPYVHGGVSNWIQMIIENFPQITFSVLSISTSKGDVGDYKYEIPRNVEQIKDVFLNEPEKKKKMKNNKKKTKKPAKNTKILQMHQ